MPRQSRDGGISSEAQPSEKGGVPCPLFPLRSSWVTSGGVVPRFWLLSKVNVSSFLGSLFGRLQQPKTCRMLRASQQWDQKQLQRMRKAGSNSRCNSWTPVASVPRSSYAIFPCAPRLLPTQTVLVLVVSDFLTGSFGPPLASERDFPPTVSI